MTTRRWEYAITTIDEGEVPVPPADGYRLKNVVIGMPNIFPDYLLPPHEAAEPPDPKVVNLAAARQQKEGAYVPFKIEPPRVRWTLIWEREVS